MDDIITWVGHTERLNTTSTGKHYGYRKYWKMLYIGEDGKLHSKYLSGRLEAWWYSRKVQKLKTYTCHVCGFKYVSNIERCMKCQ